MLTENTTNLGSGKNMPDVCHVYIVEIKKKIILCIPLNVSITFECLLMCLSEGITTEDFLIKRFPIRMLDPLAIQKTFKRTLEGEYRASPLRSASDSAGLINTPALSFFQPVDNYTFGMSSV